MATLLLQLVLVVGLLGSVQLAPVYENKNSSVGLDNTKSDGSDRSPLYPPCSSTQWLDVKTSLCQQCTVCRKHEYELVSCGETTDTVCSRCPRDTPVFLRINYQCYECGCCKGEPGRPYKNQVQEICQKLGFPLENSCIKDGPCPTTPVTSTTPRLPPSSTSRPTPSTTPRPTLTSTTQPVTSTAVSTPTSSTTPHTTVAKSTVTASSTPSLPTAQPATESNKTWEIVGWVVLFIVIALVLVLVFRCWRNWRRQKRLRRRNGDSMTEMEEFARSPPGGVNNEGQGEGGEEAQPILGDGVGATEEQGGEGDEADPTLKDEAGGQAEEEGDGEGNGNALPQAPPPPQNPVPPQGPPLPHQGPPLLPQDPPPLQGPLVPAPGGQPAAQNANEANPPPVGVPHPINQLQPPALALRRDEDENPDAEADRVSLDSTPEADQGPGPVFHAPTAEAPYNREGPPSDLSVDQWANQWASGPPDQDT